MFLLIIRKSLIRQILAILQLISKMIFKRKLRRWILTSSVARSGLTLGSPIAKYSPVRKNKPSCLLWVVAGGSQRWLLRRARIQRNRQHPWLRQRWSILGLDWSLYPWSASQFIAKEVPCWCCCARWRWPIFSRGFGDFAATKWWSSAGDQAIVHLGLMEVRFADTMRGDSGHWWSGEDS